MADSEKLQVWNNAAFDDATGPASASASASAAKLLWPPPLRPISANRSDPLDVDPIKENQNPAFPRSSTSYKKSPAPTIAVKRVPRVAFQEQAGVDGSNIEDEIEKIEKEVERLSARLRELRIKKGERDSHASATKKRDRIGLAKFMDPTKQGTAKNAAGSPALVRIRERGVSLGPLEILGSPVALLSQKQSLTNKGAPASKRIEESAATAKSGRRGLSLGPLEIHGGTKSKQLGKPEATPPTPPSKSVQSRRKSSVFEKLDDIEEEEEKRGSLKSRPSMPARASDSGKGITKSAGPKPIGFRPRGISMGPSEIAVGSIQSRQQNKLREAEEKPAKGEKQRGSSASPKSRKQSAAKASELRKGIATVGAKKPAKRDGGGDSLSAIKPKALLSHHGHGDKNTAARKGPSKSRKFRVVVSRYSLAPSRVGGGESEESKQRKWSLPEANTSQVLDLEAQAREEDILDDTQANATRSTSGGRSPLSIVKVADMLPRIKTLPCAIESPRDSGCAKRVAELVGRKSYFGAAEGGDEGGVSSHLQLNYEEED